MSIQRCKSHKARHCHNLAKKKKDCLKVVISTPTNIIAIDNNEFDLIPPKSILVHASSGMDLSKDGFMGWINKDGNFAVFDYSAGQNNYEEFKDLPRVVFPKIVAGHTRETKERLGDRVLENLHSYLDATE